MKILVTGGFGFLGSHLVEELLKDENNFVFVIDDLSTSPIDLKEYLEELYHPQNLHYWICSIKDFLAPNNKFDQIYHLASVVGPAGVLSHSGNIVKSVVNDTYKLIDLALKNNAKLVDVSTSEVYGGGQDGYCSEAFPKIIQSNTTVRLEYAVGKLAAEVAIINTCKVSNLEACIIRPFNIAGPRQSGEGGFVLPRFVSQALANRPLTVFGDGKQIRAFTHVKDVVDGIIKVMESGKNTESYNVGNPYNKISIGELAQRVIELSNSQSYILYTDPKLIYGSLYAEAANKYPDAKKIMDELNWKPRFGIDDIITDKIKEMA